MSGAIEIVSASAGTGKTYAITERLKEALLSGQARPEAVVVTTFTRKAAAELRERTRKSLLDAGRLDLARRLGAARIGTVHSVCGGLVDDLALELGLPPGLRILEGDAAGRELNRALSKAASPEQQSQLAEIQSRMPEEDWGHAVKRLVDSARLYGFSAEKLRSAAQGSTDEVLAMLGQRGDQAKIESTFLEALKAARKYFAGFKKPTGYVSKALDRAQGIADSFDKPSGTRWSEWNYFCSFAEKTAVQKEVEGGNPLAALCEAAERHRAHPVLHDDLRNWITLVFEIAAQALADYTEHKRTLGVVDFVDQETYAVRALTDPEIRASLEGDVDLVLVDEFQDTSPIQLEIFLRWSELAQSSIWVGDQKQSIYGFREADPDLLDQAVASILGDTLPETLNQSWRSRPDLVDRTSKIFADAFAAHGVSEDLVRITAAMSEEPAGLGPVLERWQLEKAKAADFPSTVADGLRQLLDDHEVRVRDPLTEEVRAVEPRDVAIICRRGEKALGVANALEDAGIPANVERKRLVDTHECAVVLAGLALWVDPKDSLALAELARLLGGSDPDEWLSELLSPVGDADLAAQAALAQLPKSVEELRARQDEASIAGLPAAIERVVEILELRELCLSWGNAEQRLANLDALRAYGVRFVEETISSGGVPTIPGLLDHLARQDSRDEKDRSDMQGVPVDRPGVTVMTYHAAKGLEWPVVILLETDWSRDPQILGVSLSWNEEISMSLDSPRAGRSARYWPNPYSRNTKNSLFHEKANDHPDARAARERAEKESLRVLYVGWTRARDRLVLASEADKLDKGMLGHLATTALAEPTETSAREEGGEVLEGSVNWGGGQSIRIPLRTGAIRSPQRPEPRPGRGPVAAGRASFSPARIPASEIRAAGEVKDQVALGSAIALAGSPDMRDLGEALHGFLAVDRPGYATELRQQLARDLLGRWCVADTLSVDSLLEVGDRLVEFVRERWPEARWHRELPLKMRRDDGTVVAGIADLVLETADECVVIDHKSFPGGLSEDPERVEEFSGQLGAYVSIMSRACPGKELSAWVHQGIAGKMVRLR